MDINNKEDIRFDAKFYIRKMREQYNKNLFSANSLRQKLHRLHLSPTHDQVDEIFEGISNIAEVRKGIPRDNIFLPYDPKHEQRVIDDFLASSSVYHEKIRRQISSVECEIASVREALTKKTVEEEEQLVVISDLRTEVSELFAEVQFKKDHCIELKIKHDVVMNDLVRIQDRFSSSAVDVQSGQSSSSSLDGMRRNIIRLLTSNKELVSQQRFMSKQLQLFGLKLKATNLEITKSRGVHQIHLPTSVGQESSVDNQSPSEDDKRKGLLSRSNSCILNSANFNTRSGDSIEDDHEGSFLRETTINVNNGATACNMYHKLFPVLNGDVLSASADLAHRRSRILHLLGREFYANWKDAQVMFSLAEALQHMATLRNIDGAVQFVMSAICRLCECDRASYWVVDKQKGIAWTKVPSFAPATAKAPDTFRHDDDPNPEEGCDGNPETLGDELAASKPKENPNMTTLMIPVNTGLVGAAFKTGTVLNISDAYGDPRFNRMVDLKTEYRTKSVLCYPIVYHGQVLGVCQCINKISPSASVFSQADIETVKTLGSAMLNVLGSCHAHEESKRLTERRSILVDSICEIVRRMRNRKDLVIVVRDTLRKIFKAHDAAIVLVYKDFYAKISIDFDGSVSLVESDRDDKAGGLIHACCEQKSPLHVFGRGALSSWKHKLAKVDLDILKTGCLDSSANPTLLQEGDVSVHCIPLYSLSRTTEISAVIQWVCLDRSVIGFGDDGSFDERNQIHVDMVNRLMTVVRFHVERFWPSKYRLLWTKAKHLQLKIRGMISFTSAGRTNDTEPEVVHPLLKSTPAPTNRRIIDLWIKAKNGVLENKLLSKISKEETPPGERKRITTQSTADFIDQMSRERGSLMKRSTVTINPNALEELIAASNGVTSPFAKKKLSPKIDRAEVDQTLFEESSSESDRSSESSSSLSDS